MHDNADNDKMRELLLEALVISRSEWYPKLVMFLTWRGQVHAR